MMQMEYNSYLLWFYRDKNFEFCLLQILGWFGLSLVSYLGFYMWYFDSHYHYLSMAIYDALVGILISQPLRIIFNFYVGHGLISRLSVALASITVCSLVASLVTFSIEKLVHDWDTGFSGDFPGRFVWFLVIFSCWVALYYGIKHYQLVQAQKQTLQKVISDNQREQLKRSQAETMAREAQLKMLRYQLNPHFLFNTLNAISALVQIKQSTKANNMIVQLSQFLRYSLDNDPIQMVTLQQELDALKLYLNIEQTRFGNRLILKFDIQPECDPIHVPSLILQPLVENAIKYGIASRETGGKLTVRARMDGSFISLEITDTGARVAKTNVTAESKTSSGFGLTNTRDRLRAFYGERYEFNVESAIDGGFRADMRLPLDNC